MCGFSQGNICSDTKRKQGGILGPSPLGLTPQPGKGEGGGQRAFVRQRGGEDAREGLKLREGASGVYGKPKKKRGGVPLTRALLQMGG